MNGETVWVVLQITSIQGLGTVSVAPRIIGAAASFEGAQLVVRAADDNLGGVSVHKMTVRG